MFAPMLLGSYVSSRNNFAPRRLVFVTELVLLPISILMTVLVATGAVHMWMVYPLSLIHI